MKIVLIILVLSLMPVSISFAQDVSTDEVELYEQEAPVVTLEDADDADQGYNYEEEYDFEDEETVDFDETVAEDTEYDYADDSADFDDDYDMDEDYEEDQEDDTESIE